MPALGITLAKLSIPVVPLTFMTVSLKSLATQLHGMGKIYGDRVGSTTPPGPGSELGLPIK